MHVLSFSEFARLRFALALSGLVACNGGAPTQAQVAIEPEQGGVDFKIQGEYAGKTAQGDSLAAQVIANGTGSFTAVFLPGGLPGAGWDGKTRVEANGTLQGPQASFSGAGYTATIASEGLTLSGQGAGGNFSLAKVNRVSPTMGLAPLAGAAVLFDGSGISEWVDVTMDARKLLLPSVTPFRLSGGASKQTFRNFTLHLEFRTPFMPTGQGTGRGNSGVYLQARYEVQILDSFGKSLVITGDTLAPARECGAFWEYRRPPLNMCFPPLSWQTYDIDFVEAKFGAGGQRTEMAMATVRLNGVLLHENVRLVNPTLGGNPESTAGGPIFLQAYGDPVYFRNIWVVEKGASIPPGLLLKKRAGGRGPGPKASLTGRRMAFTPASSPAGFYAGAGGAFLFLPESR